MPLVTPGMPCISVTLLLMKYSSHVALRDSESQKDLHSLVVTVSLSISMTFAHTSYPLERRVRFPSRQTLRRQSTKASLTYRCYVDAGEGFHFDIAFNTPLSSSVMIYIEQVDITEKSPNLDQCIKSLTGRQGGRWRSWWLQRKQTGWRGWHRPGRPVPTCSHISPPQTPPVTWSSGRWCRTPACCWGAPPPPPPPPDPQSGRWLPEEWYKSERMEDGGMKVEGGDVEGERRGGVGHGRKEWKL